MILFFSVRSVYTQVNLLRIMQKVITFVEKKHSDTNDLKTGVRWDGHCNSYQKQGLDE